MSYGELKIDTITFTAGGVDASVSVSGLVQNPTFTGNITTTGTISGDVIKGNTVSGATVTGDAGEFGTITGNTAGFTTVTGTTVTGTTANFVTISGTTVTGNIGLFTTITGGIHTLTSGVFASGTAANPSITFVDDLDTGIYASAANEVAISTSGTGRLFVDGSGRISLGQASSALQSDGTGLTIYGASASEIKFLNSTTGSASTDGTALVVTSSDFTINNREAGSISFGTSNTPRLLITATGELKHIGGGTEGSPGVYFAGSAPSNSLYVQATTGNVGLGDSAPANKLQILEALAAIPSLGSGGHAVAVAGSTNYGLALGGLTTGDGYLQAGRWSGTATAYNLLLQPKGGSVGIGTTSPGSLGELLQVIGKARFQEAAASGAIALIGADATAAYLDTGTYGTVQPIAFRLNGDEKARIDSSGRLLVSSTNARTNIDYAFGTAAAPFQIERADALPCAAIISNYDSVTVGAPAYFVLARSGSTAKGSTTIVADGNRLGEIDFSGSDGANFTIAASIRGEVDGTPGTDDMPGRLVFSTNSGTSSPDTRMTIKSDGKVGIGTTNPDYKLHVWESTGANLLKLNGLNSYNLNITNNYDSGTRYDFSIGSGAGAFSFTTSAGERVRIDSSGRLLVGTTSTLDVGSSSHILQTETTGHNVSHTRHGGTLGIAGPVLSFARSRGTTAGSVTAVVDGDNLGYIMFHGANGTDFSNRAAWIACEVDGTPFSGGDTTDLPGRLVFSTTADGASSPTERMRIRTDGFLQATATGSYASTIGYNFAWDTVSRFLIKHTSPTAGNNFGLQINYAASPNNTQNEFIYCNDSVNTRFIARSNGGLANYQSNDVNLCDEREKKNIETLDSTWGCLKHWELKKFHYNEDADTDDKRYGVIAQQIAPHCPEVISDWVKQRAEDAVLDDDGNEVEPAKEEIVRMGVKEQQMMWMAIKALQEAQTRIETLEAEVAALKGA
jgi:hypothetical protein